MSSATQSLPKDPDALRRLFRLKPCVSPGYLDSGKCRPLCIHERRQRSFTQGSSAILTAHPPGVSATSVASTATVPA